MRETFDVNGIRHLSQLELGATLLCGSGSPMAAITLLHLQARRGCASGLEGGTSGCCNPPVHPSGEAAACVGPAVYTRPYGARGDWWGAHCPGRQCSWPADLGLTLAGERGARLPAVFSGD